MTPTSFAILFLALILVSSDAKSVKPEDESVLSGRLFVLDPTTGDQQRISRRHLLDVNNADSKKFRLDIGSEAFDMELSQGSVWGENSKVMARRGENGETLEEVPVDIDNDCYLVGRLTSHKGVVSINRCQRMVGIMDIGKRHYELEEEEMDDDVSERSDDEDVPELKITMRAEPEYNLQKLNDEELVFLHELKNDGNDNNTNIASTTTESFIESGDDDTEKRAPVKVTLELGLYVDENFAKYMKNAKKLTTEEKFTNWLILKWNSVKEVYGDIKKVGVDFTIQLKHVEIWWKNEGAYGKLKDSDTLSIHLKTFCQKMSGGPDVDHKMLYTRGTGNHALGLAYVGGICNDAIKCSLSKSPSSSVRIEIHELGHNLGFRHEPDMQPCELPAGFMGWDDTYRFQDCYRKMLVATVKLRSRKCLFNEDVSKPELKSSSTKSKQRKNRRKNKNCNRKRNKNC